MLVLSRKTNQEILINGNIKVSILKVKGNVVRVGIEAPAEVSIKRGELVTREIEFPIGENTGTNDQALTISEEPAGFQLLPVATEESLDDSEGEDLENPFLTQFPETLQRQLC